VAKEGLGTVVFANVMTYTGQTSVNAGTLKLDGFINAGSTVAVGTAGTLTGIGTVEGNATLTGGGTINLSNGTISGTLTVAGGNWRGEGNVFGAVTSGTGTFRIGTGALLTAFGGLTATAGEVVVNGTLNGSVTTQSGATLSGTGNVIGTSTIQGIHSPGNSPGIQTFSGDVAYTGGASTVNWELSGNTVANSANPNATFDQIVVTGNLDFTDATTIGLSFNGAGSAVLWSDAFWSTSRSWLFYDVTGATTNFANLSLAPLNWLDSGSNGFNAVRPGSFFALAQSGTDVVINYVAIPEPHAALFVGLGLLTLLRRRRTA
jgi:autotransporter-associated beta strand protein